MADKNEQQDPSALFYDMLAQHNESILRMEAAWTEMIKTITATESDNKACRDKFLLAFPDGDHEAHRRLHEAEILRIENKAKFWADIGASVAKWGVLGALGFAGVAVWHAVASAVMAAVINK